MAFSITDWNIDENREWYVRINDNGSNIIVELYYTQNDATNQTNRIDYGYASFGTEQECILVESTGYFRDEYSWHLKVSGSDGDTFKIFRVKPFVELDEITHSIYRSTDLINMRSTYEVNLHTNATMTRDMQLATHLPVTEVGNIVRLNSIRRNCNDLSQIESHTISGGVGVLTSHITTVKYVTVTR